MEKFLKLITSSSEIVDEGILAAAILKLLSYENTLKTLKTRGMRQK